MSSKPTNRKPQLNREPGQDRAPGTERSPCTCCGYLTVLTANRASLNTCAVCLWQDDKVQTDDPNLAGGANTMSLNKARANYKRFGAVDKRSLGHVRPPRDEELPAGIDRASTYIKQHQSRMYRSGLLLFLAVLFVAGLQHFTVGIVPIDPGSYGVGYIVGRSNVSDFIVAHQGVRNTDQHEKLLDIIIPSLAYVDAGSDQYAPVDGLWTVRASAETVVNPQLDPDLHDEVLEVVQYIWPNHIHRGLPYTHTYKEYYIPGAILLYAIMAIGILLAIPLAARLAINYYILNRAYSRQSRIECKRCGYEDINIYDRCTECGLLNDFQLAVEIK